MNWFDSAEEILAKWKAQEVSAQKQLQKFTPRARQVLGLAWKEATRLNSAFVGSDHILIGIIGLGQGVATNVLIKQGFTLDKVREQMEKQGGKDPEQNRIPYTPRAKRILQEAEREAQTVHHTYIGTEHLLLGLLGESEGPAYRILNNLGMDIEQTRKEIRKELAAKFP